MVREQSGLRPRLIDGIGARWDSPSGFSLVPGAKSFELWENSIADRLGLIAAARYALSLGIAEIEAEVTARASLTRSLLSSIPGVEVHDLGRQRCGLVSFSVAGRDHAEVRDLLWGEGVAVTVTRASSTRFDMTRRGLDSMLRASPHYFVSPTQITEFASRLADV